MHQARKISIAALLFFSLTIGSFFTPSANSAQAAFKSYKAYVKSYALPIRNQPSRTFKTIRTVYMNTRITVIGEKYGYAYIYSGGKKGYVEKKWLKSRIESEKAYVTASALNVRTGPGTKYKAVKTLRHNDKVTISGYYSGWYGIKNGNQTLFASTKYIKKGTPAPKLNYTPITAFTAYIGYDNLKVYKDPSAKSSVIVTLREKTAVKVIGQNGDWRRIRTGDGKEGFVDKSNVTTDLSRFNPQTSAGTLGIDVSHYQGSIDFNAVKAAGNSFIIIKASEGTSYEDSKFKANATAAAKAGLSINAYHFFRAATTATAQKEADQFANTLKNAGFTQDKLDYLFVDVETTKGIKSNVKTQLTQNVNAFLKRMRERGYSKLGIYSGLSFFNTYIDMKKIDQPQRLHVWIARYRGQDTSKGIGADFQVDIWQYTSNGTVKGVSGAVDKNIAFYNPNAQ